MLYDIQQTWIVNGSVVLGSNKKCHNLSINRSSKSIIHYLIVATAAPLPWQLARSGEEEGAVMEWLLGAAGGWWSGIDWDLVLMEYLLCSIRCCSSGHHTNKYPNRIRYYISVQERVVVCGKIFIQYCFIDSKCHRQMFLYISDTIVR